LVQKRSAPRIHASSAQISVHQFELQDPLRKTKLARKQRQGLGSYPKPTLIQTFSVFPFFLFFLKKDEFEDGKLETSGISYADS
jgi:hypothetical protein